MLAFDVARHVAEVVLIDNLVRSILDECVAKVKIPVPAWELVDPEKDPEKVVFKIGLAIATYSPEEQKIYFNQYPLLRVWRKNPEKTKRFMRFVVAEEYWHHVQHVNGVIFYDRFYGVRPIVERNARIKAEELSGVSRDEMRELVRELFPRWWLSRH